MNRRSVTGPLILILLGVLFLLGQFRPELTMFRLISVYWPFLLIFWGVARLVEVIVLYSRSSPLPAKGFSGGEVFVVVLVCLLGSALFAASRVAPNFNIGEWRPRGLEVFGEQFEYPVEGQRSTAGIKTIVFENHRGGIRVSGADLEEIKIQGHKQIRGYEKSDADAADEKTPLEFVVQGDRLLVRTNQERVSGDRNRVSHELEVTVPRHVSVETRGRYGDIEVNGIQGGADVGSDNAGVRLRDIGGDVHVDLRRSDVVRASGVKGKLELTGKGNDVELENISGQVSINGSYSGELVFRNLEKPLQFNSRQTELRVEKVAGEIHMDLGDFKANDLVGPVRLITKSRDIQIEKFTQALVIESERGDITLRPGVTPLPKITARCRSGNVELTVPASSKFDLKATTDRGEGVNDFGDTIRQESNGKGASLKGGSSGGPPIEIATNRGTIRVSKE